MYGFRVFKSEVEITEYVNDLSDDVDLVGGPREYPCIGCVFMCADESMSMYYLYENDLNNMLNKLNEKKWIT